MTFGYHGPGVGTNRMHQKARGRLIETKEYKAALDAMTLVFRSQHSEKPCTEPVEVSLWIRCPKLADYHNYEKGILDALEKAGVYENDRQVVHTNTSRSIGHTKPGTITVHASVQLCNPVPRTDVETMLDEIEGEYG